MLLPEEFEKNIKSVLNEEWETFVHALNSTPPVSIRLNSEKPVKILSNEHVPWCETGFYLNKRPSFTFDPLFHAGVYYVQEASSMFMEQIFKQYLCGTDIKVLDLCAAPGGKSTHIASLISKNSLLVVNEVIRSRAGILAENMIKWGYPNVIVTNNDPADFSSLHGFFDAVIIDAPCSGEGMFRKDDKAIQEWSPANVKLCMERQRRIIAEAWNALKPGGILIYSTCTYNKTENEDNVIWMRDTLSAQVLPVKILPEWNIKLSYYSDLDCYHFFPHKVKGEGFFISVLRKTGDPCDIFEPPLRKGKSESRKEMNKSGDIYRNYLNNPQDFAFFNKESFYCAFPLKLYNEYNKIASKLRVVSAGVTIGEFKGTDFIPGHSLAMSVNLNCNNFSVQEIGLDEAITFLKKESLLLSELPKGYILLTYKNYPLGFVKNLGNRANNLYPGEWRIRTSYIPKEKDNMVEFDI